jgi:hypothetical protein
MPMERELLDAIGGYREQMEQLRELCSDAAAPSAEAQEARQVGARCSRCSAGWGLAFSEALRHPSRVRS